MKTVRSRIFMLVVSFILFCLPLLARPRMMTKVPANPTENQDYFEKTKRGIRNLVSKSDVIITGRITKFYHSRQKTNGLEVGGVAFDVEVEKVLLGENLPKQLHVKSKIHDSYGVYKKNEKVLLFLYYSNNKLFQVPPACYIQKAIESDDGENAYIPHGGIYIYPSDDFSDLIDQTITECRTSLVKPKKPYSPRFFSGWFFMLLIGFAMLSIICIILPYRKSVGVQGVQRPQNEDKK